MIWLLAQRCGNSFLPDLYKGLRRGDSCQVRIDSAQDGIKVLANIIQVILAVSGLLAVAFIIIGGIMYITSLGDPAGTAKAKQTIYYAVIGMVIVLIAYGIVEFIVRGFGA